MGLDHKIRAIPTVVMISINVGGRNSPNPLPFLEVEGKCSEWEDAYQFVRANDFFLGWASQNHWLKPDSHFFDKLIMGERRGGEKIGLI